MHRSEKQYLKVKEDKRKEKRKQNEKKRKKKIHVISGAKDLGY